MPRLGELGLQKKASGTGNDSLPRSCKTCIAVGRLGNAGTHGYGFGPTYSSLAEIGQPVPLQEKGYIPVSDAGKAWPLLLGATWPNSIPVMHPLEIAHLH
jgi:hypothetical protein